MFVPQYFRVIRAEVVRVKAEPFVESARVIGVPTSRILFRHVLRNSTRTIPVIVTLNASEALLTLAGLGFLGFGIEPTAAAEWGYDLEPLRAGRHERHLVDGDPAGRRDRARGARHHARRREPQRPERSATAHASPGRCACRS